MSTLPSIYQGTNEYFVTLFSYSIIIYNIIFIGLYNNLQNFLFHVKCSVFVASICKTKTVIYLTSKSDALYKPSASAGKRLLAKSADDRLNSFSFFFLFITKKTGFDVSCSGDNLHEVQIMFSWKNEKSISKCRLLKIVPNVLIVKVCTNNSCMSLFMAKTTVKLVRRDESACTF